MLEVEGVINDHEIVAGRRDLLIRARVISVPAASLKKGSTSSGI